MTELSHIYKNDTFGPLQLIVNEVSGAAMHSADQDEQVGTGDEDLR